MPNNRLHVKKEPWDVYFLPQFSSARLVDCNATLKPQ